MKLKNRTSSLLKSRTTSKISPTKTVEQKLFTCPEEPMSLGTLWEQLY